jgi:hypothetical protein
MAIPDIVEKSTRQIKAYQYGYDTTDIVEIYCRSRNVHCLVYYTFEKPGSSIAEKFRPYYCKNSAGNGKYEYQD